MHIMKISKFPILLIIAAIGNFLFSCSYHKEDVLYPNPPVCDTTNVTYSAVIKPLIETHCAISTCHVSGGSASTSGIFDNYAAVKAKVDNGSMYNRVVVLRDMPSDHVLTDCQVNQMARWIYSGALNN